MERLSKELELAKQESDNVNLAEYRKMFCDKYVYCTEYEDIPSVGKVTHIDVEDGDVCIWIKELFLNSEDIKFCDEESYEPSKLKIISEEEAKKYLYAFADKLFDKMIK